MTTNELTFLKNQAGIESSRGVGVAATRKVYADITPTIEIPFNWLRSRTGTYKSRRKPAKGRPRVSFAGVDSATFEDLPWWLQFCLKGGVTGVTDGGTPPAYEYAFLMSLATDDLKSMTLEFNEAGNPMKATQVMANTWTLRMDPDNDQENEWMLDLGLIGRNVQTGITYTAALPERDTNPILAKGTKLYIDDDTASLGATQILGKLISVSISGSNNIHLKAFAEDENEFPAGKVGRGDATVDAQFVFEFDDSDELDNFLSPTPVQRAIRLERSGATIHGTPTTTELMQLDMAGYWSSWSRGDREGNLTATFGAQFGYDATLGGDFMATVVTDLATLP